MKIDFESIVEKTNELRETYAQYREEHPTADTSRFVDDQLPGLLLMVLDIQIVWLSSILDNQTRILKHLESKK